GGTLTSSDVDNDDNKFIAQASTRGEERSVGKDGDGMWAFTANSAFDSLNVGDEVTGTFSVASVDGTTSSVKITIEGTNDSATVSSADETLAETDAALVFGGTLTSSDVDNDDNKFIAQAST